MLVQYAGSLVGWDFCIILQVTPIVLQGLIPNTHYEVWLVLCRLVPLMFQPVIENISEYIVSITLLTVKRNEPSEHAAVT